MPDLASDPGYSPARRLLVYGIGGLAAAGLGYYGVAYGLLPGVWRYFEHRHPALAALATRTVTIDGIPGDPINIAVVGDEVALHRALAACGWEPADAVTLAAALRIATDSVAHRPYGTAPVSSLYFWGRRQDLAFEQMIGGDPRRRHHVRFWKSAQVDDDGRPLWVGAATLDTRAGVSHRTGQITHHIDAAIDQERDKLLADLGRDLTTTVEWIDSFQAALSGKNGGGDRYYTDGRLAVVTLE
ncbi:MAG TPA: LssY C-terminal domain-containing protein [Steroidobacteraceae bacterium]|nr:LssY C-terminal domain-containing protein [Steroidobacteraceae bacterium]